MSYRNKLPRFQLLKVATRLLATLNRTPKNDPDRASLEAEIAVIKRLLAERYEEHSAPGASLDADARSARQHEVQELSKSLFGYYLGKENPTDAAHKSIAAAEAFVAVWEKKLKNRTDGQET